MLQVPNTLEEVAGTVGVSVGELIMGVLLEGAIGGAVLALIAFVLSRFTREIYGRVLLALFLFAAAGAYFGFAVLAGAGPIWMLVELVGVFVFGIMGLLGLRGSPWWLGSTARRSPTRTASGACWSPPASAYLASPACGWTPATGDGARSGRRKPWVWRSRWSTAPPSPRPRRS
jgi:hypothetical protein